MSELATSFPNKTSDATIKMAQALRNLQCAVTQAHDAIFIITEAAGLIIITEAAGLISIITEAAGLISRVNPAFEKLTSYSSIEVIGKDMSLLIADGPQSVRLKKKSGEHCDTDMTLTPLSDGRGQITSVVCSCQALRDGAEVVRVSSANSTPMLEIAHHLNNVLLMLMANADLTCSALPAEHLLCSECRT